MNIYKVLSYFTVLALCANAMASDSDKGKEKEDNPFATTVGAAPEPQNRPSLRRKNAKQLLAVDVCPAEISKSDLIQIMGAGDHFVSINGASSGHVPNQVELGDYVLRSKEPASGEILKAIIASKRAKGTSFHEESRPNDTNQDPNGVLCYYKIVDEADGSVIRNSVTIAVSRK